MARVPKVQIQSASASVKSAEVSGIVTVGPETAEILSKQLGRKVEVGEKFDLGVLAYHHEKPLKRIWGTLKAMYRHSKSPFAKPLKKDPTP